MFILSANNTVGSSVFTYNKAGKQLVCEASDLKEVLISRVYDDAIDIGFIIESDYTGLKMAVSCQDTVYNAEGEITAWAFRPIQIDQPGFADTNRIYEVIILND